MLATIIVVATLSAAAPAGAHIAIRLDIRSPRSGEHTGSDPQLVVFAQPMLAGRPDATFDVLVDGSPIDGGTGGRRGHHSPFTSPPATRPPSGCATSHLAATRSPSATDPTPTNRSRPRPSPSSSASRVTGPRGRHSRRPVGWQWPPSALCSRAGAGSAAVSRTDDNGRDWRGMSPIRDGFPPRGAISGAGKASPSGKALALGGA